MNPYSLVALPISAFSYYYSLYVIGEEWPEFELLKKPEDIRIQITPLRHTIREEYAPASIEVWLNGESQIFRIGRASKDLVVGNGFFAWLIAYDDFLEDVVAPIPKEEVYKAFREWNPPLPPDNKLHYLLMQENDAFLPFQPDEKTGSQPLLVGYAIYPPTGNMYFAVAGDYLYINSKPMDIALATYQAWTARNDKAGVLPSGVDAVDAEQEYIRDFAAKIDTLIKKLEVEANE